MEPALTHGVSARVYYPGTYRARSPEETWRIIAAKLAAHDITRVADVTRLDIIGIPVAVAVRPLSQALSVAQGKGITWELARVSAVMEAIEFWHAEHACPPAEHLCVSAEHACPPAEHLCVSAAQLALPYALGQLDHEPGSLFTAATPLDWVTGEGLISAEPTPVPREAVTLEAGLDPSWRPRGLRASTNGLASGNSRAEAAVHALYELVERDTLHRADALAPPCFVDPHSLEGHGAELAGKILDASVYLEVTHLANRWGLACFRSVVRSEDFPVLAVGAGAHMDPEVALSRSLAEAVQSRLTAISGSRDDLARIYDVARSALIAPPEPPAVLTPWPLVASADHPVFADFETELAHLAGLVHQTTGREPILVDLSTCADFAVVKVLAPGLGFTGERNE